MIRVYDKTLDSSMGTSYSLQSASRVHPITRGNFTPIFLGVLRWGPNFLRPDHCTRMRDKNGQLTLTGKSQRNLSVRLDQKQKFTKKWTWVKHFLSPLKWFKISFAKLKIIRFWRPKYLWNPHRKIFPNLTITFQLNDFFIFLSVHENLPRY